MKRKEIERTAKDQLEKYGVRSTLQTDYGEPLLLCVTGADSFGFPSPDSDIDIKGLYRAPNKRFLGFRQRVRTFIYMSPDRMLDVAIDEVGHFFELLAKSNADRIEWVNGDLTILQDDSIHDLRDVVNEYAISKEVFFHYQSLARQIASSKDKPPVKGDLYSLRTYMTGITLLEEGRVIRDLEQLNEKFRFPVVEKAIESKRHGETTEIKLYSVEEMDRTLQILDERLIAAHSHSSLQEEPNRKALEEYLVSLRES